MAIPATGLDAALTALTRFPDVSIVCAPDIVDGGVPHNFDDTGVRINLDLADMAAIGKASEIDDLIAFSREGPAQIVGQVVAAQRLGCDLEYSQ